MAIYVNLLMANFSGCQLLLKPLVMPTIYSNTLRLPGAFRGVFRGVLRPSDVACPV